MSTFRLPEWLGGGECTLLDVTPDGPVVQVATADGNTRTLRGLHMRDLVKIQPPPPPEPPSGTAAATDYTVWLRGYKGWFDGFGNDDAEETEILTWEQLNARHPEVRPLVYDPAVTAPELPYAVLDGRNRVTIQRDPYNDHSVHIELDVAGTHIAASLDHEHAPKVAAAILRAAREAGQP